jgi:hypothetical protein
VRKLIAAAAFLLTMMAASMVCAGPLPDNTVAVWYQPVSSFQKWHDRGVTTLVGYESEGGSVSQDTWMAAAKKAGLNVILQSTALRPQDRNDSNVIAIIVAPDEPDGAGNVSPGGIVDAVLAVRQVTNKPVGVNFDGNQVPWKSVAVYAAYAAPVDFCCFDVYPFNFGCQTIASATTIIKADVAKLKQAIGNKPLYAFGECSNQDLGKQPWTQGNDASGTPLSPKMRGPTALETIQEWIVFKQAGVAGVWWFPDMIGLGWEGFDGTQPDTAGALTALNLPQK